MQRPSLSIVGLAAIAACLVAITGCDLPRDPEETLESVRGKVLLVGATESPPWVRRTSSGAEGIEADLVKEFAEQLDARVEWQWDSTDANLAALKRYQPLGVTDEIRQRLRQLNWVKDADVRLRTDGSQFAGEVYIVPRDQEQLVEKLHEATKVAKQTDWRVCDIVATAVATLNDPQSDKVQKQ